MRSGPTDCHLAFLALVANHAAVEAPAAATPAGTAFMVPRLAAADPATKAAVVTPAADVADTRDVTMKAPRSPFATAVPVMDFLNQAAGVGG